MAYGIVSRDVADVVPPDAMADLSRVVSNLSMADLSRATMVMSNLSKGMSSSISRTHEKIGPPQEVLLHLDGKVLHEKG